MRRMIFVGLVAALLGVLTCVDGSPPATEPGQQPENTTTKHDQAILEARETLSEAWQGDQDAYHAAILAADQQYVAELDAALKAANSVRDTNLAFTIDHQILEAKEMLREHQLEDTDKVVAEMKAHGDEPRPSVTFSKINSRANRIAFVCDASGSMMVKFDPLRVALRKSINALKPTQSFQVIFFQETGCAAVDPNGLLLATPENKRKAFDFCDKTAPRGSTDPIPALDLAFKQGAQLVYLLTDGDFPDNEAVLNEIHKLNPDKKVRISTIAFLDHDEEYEKMLRKIADENGGAFLFVSEEEIEK